MLHTAYSCAQDTMTVMIECCRTSHHQHLDAVYTLLMRLLLREAFDGEQECARLPLLLPTLPPAQASHAQARACQGMLSS